MARNKRKNQSPNGPLLYPDHKLPVTRRQFLNAGFITSAAAVVMPTVLTSLMSKKAYAAFDAALDCGIGGLGSGKIPFICVDLGGGANMAGSNVLVGQGGSEGQMAFLSDAAYAKMGLPASMSPRANPAMINTDLGLAFHADSAFLRGILSKTSAACRANVNGAVIPARSDNDTSNNPHNPVYGIARAGAVGSLAKLIGTSNSDSGGRSVAPADMIDLTIRPTKISSANDARGLVDTGAVSALMPDKNEAGRVMLAAENISLAKINGTTTDSVPDVDLASKPGTTVQDLVHCGYAKTTNTVSSFGGPSDVDPMADTYMLDPNNPLTTTVSNTTTDLTALGSTVTDSSSIFSDTEISGGALGSAAAITKLILGSTGDPFSGAGTIALGGYDYHNSTRATGERQDFRAGQVIGSILQYAHRYSNDPAFPNRSKPVMVYVFTDGSLASNGALDNSADGRGKGVWTGDNSSTSAAFFLVYNPGGRAQLLQDGNQSAAQHQQLGYMSASGSVVTNGTTPGANSPNLLAEMCILNWMALNNMSLDDSANPNSFVSLFPNHGLGDPAQLRRWVAFNPIV